MAQSKWTVTVKYTVHCGVSGQGLVTHTDLTRAINDCSQFMSAYIRRTVQIKVDATLTVTSVADIHLPVHDQYTLNEEWREELRK